MLAHLLLDHLGMKYVSALIAITFLFFTFSMPSRAYRIEGGHESENVIDLTVPIDCPGNCVAGPLGDTCDSPSRPSSVQYNSGACTPSAEDPTKSSGMCLVVTINCGSPLPSPLPEWLDPLEVLPNGDIDEEIEFELEDSLPTEPTFDPNDVPSPEAEFEPTYEPDPDVVSPNGELPDVTM
jgi:hypothetical protein